MIRKNGIKEWVKHSYEYDNVYLILQVLQTKNYVYIVRVPFYISVTSLTNQNKIFIFCGLTNNYCNWFASPIHICTEQTKCLSYIELSAFTNSHCVYDSFAFKFTSMFIFL